MGKIIKLDRSIIPACDVDIKKLDKIAWETADIEKVGAYKVGFQLGLGYGLREVVDTIMKWTLKPVIYDHQKAGTDIPATGKNFAEIMSKAGIKAAILFPQSGPETQKAWTEALQEKGIEVIVGGLMTHKGYSTKDGGYIQHDKIKEIYGNAVDQGVTNFVVPGNKPDDIKEIKDIIVNKGITPTFYAPGFVAQGGEIGEGAKAAGEFFHAIVGRGIYKAENIKKAAEELTSKL